MENTVFRVPQCQVSSFKIEVIVATWVDLLIVIDYFGGIVCTIKLAEQAEKSSLIECQGAVVP